MTSLIFMGWNVSNDKMGNKRVNTRRAVANHKGSVQSAANRPAEPIRRMGPNDLADKPVAESVIPILIPSVTHDLSFRFGSTLASHAPIHTAEDHLIRAG
jgi:hypothetical protein